MNAIRPEVPPATAVATAIAPTAPESAVSWAAIFAGAVGSAALSLILVILGLGLGLSAVSPWSFEGVSKETFGWSSIIWLAFTTIAASGLGGYLAGRLRTKWTQLHGDETYFRDTAHGFISWAVATLLAAGLLTSAIGGILGAGGKVAGAAAGAAATDAGGIAMAAGPGMDDGKQGPDRGMPYWVDSLFRSDAAAPAPAPAPGDLPDRTAGAPAGAADARPPMDRPAPPADARRAPQPGMAGPGPRHVDREERAEATRIVLNSLAGDGLDDADKRYLSQMVARETGLSPAEAEARVNDMQTRMRAAMDKAKEQATQLADDARKATAHAALWLFITLLIGAFSASLAATWGGRCRDL
ncbi:MAG: hypothetical protein GAK31_00292 [Stenotrophomonas maltophilia]|uniref:Transmembrane protein n=1 Tax=Stenotrophomonas maltophilia TaxID=40324 RepID=A0A7V8FJ65_STEMA|nr:MAG: hypothetical protein GAK31_00292 [Stenotrophomonas maltophilia]